MAADTLTVALDANGADAGPAEVARGAAMAAAAGVRVVVFGPADALPVAPGVEVVDAPVSIAKAADPARAVRRTPEASIVQAVRAVADGRADALVSGGSTGAALAAGSSRSSAHRACTGRRWPSSCPFPAGPSCCSTAARTSPCARSTSSSSRTWARRSWRW
jgi:hypothetical protein